MKSSTMLNLWIERLRDRARLIAFARFLWNRFVDDRLFQAAAALAYTSVFAMVPLAMVVFGVLSAFPVFEIWSDRLSDYIFKSFVPSAARSVEMYLRQFSASAGQLTAAGVIALVVSLLITLYSVETTFNRIWRVASTRPRLSRFLVYWTVLTLGALLAAASLSVSVRFFALPLFETPEGQWVAGRLLRLAPMAIEFLAVTLVYRVVPHRTVDFRHAIPGALLATLMLEAVKSGMSLYLGSFESYQRIYGTVAFVPIFILWIYLSWIAVLLGASLASSLAAFRYQPIAMRLPPGFEVYALLRVLGRFRQAREQGRGLHIVQLLESEPILTDSLAQDFIMQLSEIGLLRRSESGEWLLARDLDKVTMAELYEACQLRIPIAEAYLPHHDDVLGMTVLAALNEIRVPLRQFLKRPLSEIYDQDVNEIRDQEIPR
ncbi:MAG: YihY family inner membrane protein [Xanthomonadaceae bacterium]|jgi:membrane protein|nr:YihY family inner membrane protein [Xanthomonadaceae bacterium]